MSGDIYLDAGFMGFVDGTELDLKIIGMYVHTDTYCVVPIVNAKVRMAASARAFL